MSTTKPSGIASEPRRRRGVSAGLNRARIVEAARDMDPETLTVQAVANELGVDRKAVTHHVKDRDRLLQLVAIDAFSSSFRGAEMAKDVDWRTACRSYATCIVDGLLATGTLASYFRLPNSHLDSDVVEVLRPAELVLEKLLEAGFDELSAARALTMLANLALGYARDRVLAEEFGEHPQTGELRSTIARSASTEYRAIAHLVTSNLTAYDDAQFAWYLDVTIGGMELLRTSRSPS